jgi:hypothetical protein
MDEPDRMLDQTASSLERALVQEGRSYHGPEELRAHTLAALGLAGSAGLATGGVLAWLAVKSWTTKLLLTMSATTLLVAIPLGYVTLRKGGKPTTLPLSLPAVVSQPFHEMTANAASPVDVEAPAPSVVLAPQTVMTPSTARASTASASSALRAELAALDAVRSTLANDDSVGALSFLDAYFRTYPRGRLHLEAEVLRVDALAKGGRLDAARGYAQEFLKRHPNSVLAAHVQTYAER